MLNNTSITSFIFKNITYAIIGTIATIVGLAIIVVTILSILYGLGYIIFQGSYLFGYDSILWSILPSTNYIKIGLGFFIATFFFIILTVCFSYSMKELGKKITNHLLVQ